MIPPFDFQPRTHVLFGAGKFATLGELACALQFQRTLLVADRGMIACGYVDTAVTLLKQNRIEVFPFHDFSENPDTQMIETGRVLAESLNLDSIIGLGGGSSLDTAKGINFVLTNGGTMKDYWGHNKASKPMLPMIGVPTTSGTGSEAQSYALISDAETHVKMACGDDKAAFRVALLDPELTVTQPTSLTATAGYDALAHAVETFVTTKRTPLSEMYAREAWRLLEHNFERVLNEPNEVEARAAMQLGAYFAGAAIEASMLGATHACANPLTAQYGTPHGEAIALMLPSVVRWNAEVVGERYAELLRIAGHATGNDPGETLARRLEQLTQAGKLPRQLRTIGVPHTDLARLAEAAAKQWTGTFNPRAWSATGAFEVYQWAY
ncbi:MAG: iron-containing alcohol dehydrogenase [Blastocatellia bacterium]|nr:iron-containing alcohol dehydrogenase [Blastocatellia bacterium]